MQANYCKVPDLTDCCKNYTTGLVKIKVSLESFQIWLVVLIW